MSYWLDIKSHPNLIVYSEHIPRIGEVMILRPLTLENQEDELKFTVVDVIYHLDGQRLSKEMPIVALEAIHN